MPTFLPDPTAAPRATSRLLTAAPRPTRPVAAPSGPWPWLVTASRWLRRAHLYSGLLLVPFVLVYGISAFLFNHPAARGGGARNEAPRAEPLSVPVAAELRAQLPAADELAASVAAVLDGEAPLPGSAGLRGSWTFDFEQDGQRRRLSLAADGSSANIRSVAAEPSRANRLPPELFAPAGEAASRVAGRVLADAGFPEVRLRGAGAPQLRYRGQATEVSASIDRRQASVRDAAAFDFGRLLMRLHTAHGYGGDQLPRLLWAAVVDLMAGAMVLWAISGLWMWWQKRSYRRAGLWVLGFTGIGAAALVSTMAASMN
ncbi:MAG: PepSY domain-containing protein [Planctomycetes bacterium]|nr:PepSY domain-containing protein [Planctomycetota bacterium]